MLTTAARVATPFFFGRRDRRLYGIYHPARARSGPPRAAVLCYPWGPEYAQSHQTVRLLADMLAAAGVHAMRFDYFGTGDSAGELIDGDVSGWAGDVLDAGEELRDISGAASVSLIGLRFGATLAALAAARDGTGIADVLLWDPVLDAGDHLDEFRRFAVRYAYARLLPTALDDEAGHEVFGFPVSDAFRRAVTALDLPAIAGGLAAPVDLIGSGDAAGFAAATAALPGCRGTVHVPAPPSWIPGVHFVPYPVLSAIVDMVARRS